MTRVIDVHAHVLTREMMADMRREAPAIGPKLAEEGVEHTVLTTAGTPYHPFPRGGWDLERRFADLEANGIDMQVLAVCPQTLLYDIDPKLALTLAQLQNEAIAKLVRSHPDTFLGLAHLPLQSPADSVAELTRAMKDLGLVGAQIGSHVEGKNLDDPALEPLWARAEELGAFIMIHPQKPAGGKRLDANYFKNLIGNPLETTIAGGSLIFAGVMERYPALRILLVHGGGFLPYQYGRFQHGWHVREEPQIGLSVPPEASARRFFFDTLTHSEPALRYLVGEFGAEHVLFGTDYPFDMGAFDNHRMVSRLGFAAAERDLIVGDRAAKLFGLSRAAAAAAE
jgi:aminocarboxymuconate-semialdehyde decarboxylase